ESADREHALALVDTTPLMRQPGDTFVYSDLGAMVLAQAVQAVSGQRLDDFLAARLFGPLGMTSTRYLPPESWRSRIAPTENDTVFRHRLLRGEVHDENAGRLGGVSGHAGLFSTAPDLARFAQWLLDTRRGHAPPFAALRRPSPPFAAPCSDVHATPKHSTRLLARPRLGHALRKLERRNADGAERIRAYRLHRYVDLVRPRQGPLHYSTDQPGESYARQHQDLSGTPARGRPRQRRAHST